MARMPDGWVVIAEGDNLGTEVQFREPVELVFCKNCRHRMTKDGEFPDGICPLQDFYGDIDHVRRVPDDWFCADGERRDDA